MTWESVFAVWSGLPGGWRLITLAVATLLSLLLCLGIIFSAVETYSEFRAALVEARRRKPAASLWAMLRETFHLWWYLARRKSEIARNVAPYYEILGDIDDSEIVRGFGKESDGTQETLEDTASREGSAQSGMNTGQLICLWYAGLLIAGILGFQAMASESSYPIIAAIVLLAGLLVYSLKPHPAARKTWVFMAVAVPVIIMALWLWRQISPVR